MLNGGGEFLPVHQEVAVARDGEGRPPGRRLAAMPAGTP